VAASHFDGVGTGRARFNSPHPGSLRFRGAVEEPRLEVHGGLDPALAAAVMPLVTASRAPSTRKAYEAIWNSFSAFCEGRQRSSLPAFTATVPHFLMHDVTAKKGRGVEDYPDCYPCFSH